MSHAAGGGGAMMTMTMIMVRAEVNSSHLHEQRIIIMFIRSIITRVQ